MGRKLSVGAAAKYLGRATKTLQRWDREGVLTALRTPTGRRTYDEEALDAFLGIRREVPVPTREVAYCRVSSAAQRPDMKNQQRVLAEFCAARGLADVEFIEEVGGGLNFKRKKFLVLMDDVGDHKIKTLVLAHKDRLVRFGFDWFERYCELHGCSLLILNQEHLSPEAEMVQDLMTIVHCFSSRLYGLRSYRKKLDAALSADQAPK